MSNYFSMRGLKSIHISSRRRWCLRVSPNCCMFYPYNTWNIGNIVLYWTVVYGERTPRCPSASNDALTVFSDTQIRHSLVSLYRGLIYHIIIYSTAMIAEEYESYFQLTKDMPYFALTREQRGIFGVLGTQFTYL